MVEVKSSQLSSWQLECEDPLFFAFITGNDACDLLTSIEQEYSVQFRIDKTSVIVEGAARIDTEPIKLALVDAWKENDFRRAIEISELTNQSDFQLYFKVSPAEAALMQVNSKKLMRCPGLLNFKADSNGNVCLFGRNSFVSEVFNTVANLVCTAAVEEKIRVEPAGPPDGPCVLSLWIPKKAAPLLFSPEGSNIADLQRSYNCFIEPHFKEADTRAGVPVVVFTKTLENALAVKEAIVALSEELSNTGKRKFSSDIRLRCGAPATHFTLEANARTRNDCKAILSSEEIRLVFLVNERDAPRIIGAHGITKKRIQECSKCAVLLHTESKRDGFFPVEIVGSNIQKCVETRRRIESFLSQTPPSAPVREQQWNTSMVEERTGTVNGKEMSQLTYSQQYILTPDILSQQQQHYAQALAWNSAALQRSQSHKGNKSVGSSSSKIPNIPKVQLSLVKMPNGFSESEKPEADDL